MNTPAKLGAYTLGLVAVFGAAAGIGSVVGPVGAAADDTATHDTAPHGETPAESPTDTSAPQSSATHLPGGLQVSAATRALQSFSLGLLDEHLAGCVVDAAQQGGPEADAKVREASEAIARLVRS